MASRLEQWIFALWAGTVAAVPLLFLRQTKDCFLLPKVCLLEVSAAALVWLLARAWLTGRLVVGRGRAFTPLLFWAAACAWVLLGALTTTNRGLTLTDLPWQAAAALFMPAGAAVCVGHDRHARLCRWLAASCALACGYGLVQYLGYDVFHWDVDPADLRLRAVSTFGNPQLLAVWAGGVAPLLLASLLGGGLFKPAGHFRTLRTGLVAFSLLLATAAMFVCHTRTAIVAFTLGAIIPLWSAGRLFPRLYLPARLLMAAVTFAAGLYVGLTVAHPLLGSGAGLHSETIEGRLFTWRLSAGIAAEHPLTGAGPGTFRYQYPLKLAAYFASRPDALTRPEFYAQRRDWAHNDWLQLACDSGIPAAALLLLFVLRVLAGALSRMHHLTQPGHILSDPEKKNLLDIAGFLASMLSLLLMSLNHFVLYNPAAGALFFAVCGVLTRFSCPGAPYLKAEPGPSGERLKPAHRLLALEALGLLLAVGLTWLTVRPLAADLLLRRGHTQIARGEYGQAYTLLSRSTAIWPHNGQAHFAAGLCLYELNSPDEALREFTRALRTLMSEGIFYSAGNTFLKSQDWGGAQKAYRRALQFDPFFADAHVNLGVALARAGAVRESAREFRLVSRGPFPIPVRVSALMDLARLYEKTGKPLQAKLCIQEATDLDPRRFPPPAPPKPVPGKKKR